MIRVSVVASSAVIRAGLEELIREDSHMAVLAPVGAGAPDGSRSNTRADVMVIEVASADKLAKAVSFHYEDSPAIVLLVDHLGRAEVRRVLYANVRGVLSRDASGPEIIAAVEAAAVGLTVLNSEQLDILLPAAVDTRVDTVAGEALSSRELEVLLMLAEGLGNKKIGARLKISEHTVKFHVSSILGKLGASTRGEAVARGVREGLIVI